MCVTSLVLSRQTHRCRNREGAPPLALEIVTAGRRSKRLRRPLSAKFGADRDERRKAHSWAMTSEFCVRILGAFGPGLTSTGKTKQGEFSVESNEKLRTDLLRCLSALDNGLVKRRCRDRRSSSGRRCRETSPWNSVVRWFASIFVAGVRGPGLDACSMLPRSRRGRRVSPIKRIFFLWSRRGHQ